MVVPKYLNYHGAIVIRLNLIVKVSPFAVSCKEEKLDVFTYSFYIVLTDFVMAFNTA